MNVTRSSVDAQSRVHCRKGETTAGVASLRQLRSVRHLALDRMALRVHVFDHGWPERPATCPVIMR